MRLILLLILLVTSQTIPSDTGSNFHVQESIICSDSSDSTKRIEVHFDSRTPEYVVSNKVQYKFKSHEVHGDIDIIQYQFGSKIISIEFTLDSDEVSAIRMEVIGAIPGMEFIDGECKLL